MLKRQNAAPKPARKRKKGNTTYQVSSLDPPVNDKIVVEELRVWDVSTSETTGRITGKRRTLKHYHQVSPNLLEEPPASKIPEGSEDVENVEDTGVLADSEPPQELVNKRRSKRKRANVSRENDSVGKPSTSLLSTLTRVSRQKWNSGFRTARLF